jgi:Protein of unknown function (DUF3105)
VAAAAIAIIVIPALRVADSNKPFGEQRAQQITGLAHFGGKNRTGLGRNHVQGKLSYPQSPPVGGNHNPVWQNCQGDVYDRPIANENAVHSLEHGAVWLTYDPALPAVKVATLRAKIQGKDYALMSPYPGLDHAVSLQAWGFQLKVSSVDDPRIDQFVKVFRQNASVETGATCSQGVTATGTDPKNSAQ